MCAPQRWSLAKEINLILLFPISFVCVYFPFRIWYYFTFITLACIYAAHVCTNKRTKQDRTYIRYNCTQQTLELIFVSFSLLYHKIFKTIEWLGSRKTRLFHFHFHFGHISCATFNLRKIFASILILKQDNGKLQRCVDT